MDRDPQLPRGFIFPDGTEIRVLLYADTGWQIYSTNENTNVLLADSTLVRRWNNEGYLDEALFSKLIVGNSEYCVIGCHEKYVLTPVQNSKSPRSKMDALSFAHALRESRKISTSTSLHDAIFIEQYSKLLPTWTLTPRVDDTVVLGTWVTGGVAISTNSFRRLSNLVGWMPANDLVEVLTAAGFDAPPALGVSSRQNTQSGTHPETDRTVAGMVDNDPSSRSESFKLPGRPHLEEFFNEYVIDIILNADRYKALGISFPSAIVLHGPPGCGKTFAAERLVEFLDWPSYAINSNAVGSPYIHETSKKISTIFDTAIENAPSVLLIDEMESYLSDRRSSSSTSLYHVEEVAEFLRRIPEATQNNVLIIAMTNLIEMIDPAILRRGRFDHIIEIDMPSREEVIPLIDSLLSKIPTEKTLQVDTILDALTGRPLSDAAFVINEAARLAAKAGKNKVDQISLDTALERIAIRREKKHRPIGFVRED